MSLPAESRVMAFVTVADAARSRAFYRDTLGLKLVSEDGFALVFDQHGTLIRAAIFPGVKPGPSTVLGWQVPDIDSAVKALAVKGVKFERFPGMDQDESGVWSAPGGAKVAWFHDPDGNVLSISQH